MGVQPLEFLAGSAHLTARHEDGSTTATPTSHISSSAPVWGPNTATPNISTGIMNSSMLIQSLEFIFSGNVEAIWKYFKYSPKKTSI